MLNICFNLGNCVMQLLKDDQLMFPVLEHLKFNEVERDANR